MLHIVYRSYGGENKKDRPPYYSKRLALLSLIRSFQQLRSRPAELIFLNDGPIPDDRFRLMKEFGEILACPKHGNVASMALALDLPRLRKWSSEDIVWFSEDDYLYQPRALPDLTAAADMHLDVAYFGLYALIGSRLPSGAIFDDLQRVPTQLEPATATLICGHPWRTALSTTSTFGCRVSVLSEDRLMMRLAMLTGGAWDHTTCLMYQGHLPYSVSHLVRSLGEAKSATDRLRRAGICAVRAGVNTYHIVRGMTRSRRRTLIAADPALATHLETLYMAAGTTWETVAADTVRWSDMTFGALN